MEIDRNVQVLSPAQAAKKVDLPPDFYALSPEELKREQQSRAEALEKQMQLRTKAMREKDELREIRKYKFALIRVRFPDGIYLQVANAYICHILNLNHLFRAHFQCMKNIRKF